MNPCGFALLPAYLARRLGGGDESQRGSDAVARALVVGGVTTVGFLLVFGTLGTAISAGAHELRGALPWAGLVIGVGLVLAGAAVLVDNARLTCFRVHTDSVSHPGGLDLQQTMDQLRIFSEANRRSRAILLQMAREEGRADVERRNLE